MQTQLFPPSASWTPPHSLKLEGRLFAIDCETRDPRLLVRGPAWAFDEGYVVGVGVSNGDTTLYMPFRHAMGGNLDEDVVKRKIASIVENPDNEVVFHNAFYDIGWLEYWGLKVRCKIHDTSIMAPLLDEHRRSYNLDGLLKDNLGIQKDERILREAAEAYKLDPKADLWKLHSQYVGTYGEMDAYGTFQLFKHFWPQMKAEGLLKVYEVEMAQIPVLLEMRKRGVRVDMDRADKTRKHFIHQEMEMLKEIKRISGFRAREGVPTADAATILRGCGVQVPKTSAGNWSVTADWLKSCDHEVARCILKARQFQKAHRDFITHGIFERHYRGRIYASFLQLKSDAGGTVSGRYASVNPNLQQIPIRDKEIGPLIRALYLPEEGCRWASIDYSSQEPRWTVWWAWKSGCRGAYQALNAFQKDPRTDYHQFVADLMAVPRRNAKDINLGLAYGMGEAKLCRTLGLDTEIDDRGYEKAGPEGQAILTKYHNKVPYMRPLSSKCSNLAKTRGYIVTYLGRRCRFQKGQEFVALNRLIQGSSADQLKIAIMECGKAGLPPLALVHDENCFSLEDDKAIARCKEIMENCVKIEMPFITDVAIGPNWGEAKE